MAAENNGKVRDRLMLIIMRIISYSVTAVIVPNTGFQGNRIRDPYRDKGQSFRQHHSDDEEDDEEGFGRCRRRGPSVDEFLRSSELGRPVRLPSSVAP